MKSVLLNLTLLFWLLTSAFSRCVGFEFTVEGGIRIQDYYQGQMEGATNYFFSAQVRDCNSRIRVSGGTFSAVEFMEFGWDTTNSYMLAKFWADRQSKIVYQADGNKTKTSTVDKPFKSRNDATLTLYTSHMPEYDCGIEPVWLAYAQALRGKAHEFGAKKLRPVFISFFLVGSIISLWILVKWKRGESKQQT